MDEQKAKHLKYFGIGRLLPYLKRKRLRVY